MLHHTTLYCLDSNSSDSIVGIFDLTIAPNLLFYAYVPALATAILMGVFILRQKSYFRLPNVLFFITTVLFALYIVNDTVQWIALPAAVVHFSWQLILLIKTLLIGSCFYFVYTFIHGTDLRLRGKLILAALFAPVVLLLPTTLNIASFDLANCESNVGIFYYYIYFLELIFAISISYMAIAHYRKHLEQTRSEVILTCLGALAFVVFLSGTDVIGEYTGEFEILMLAPLGMVIFLTLLAFIIVRYNAFNTKLLASQALVVAITIIVGSQLFFVRSAINVTLTIVALFGIIIAGYFLVRSVKREVQQREEIEGLAKNLERVNARLKQLDQLKSEFVSIASHQLRSPLAAIRGYASMLEDGSYGKLPVKATEVVQRIQDSAKLMASSVEDYLNVSRIEAGHMKYNLTDFNLREQAEHIADDIRPIAAKSGIVLLFRTDLHSQGTINADKGKTEQILHNLINNSLKYTKGGSITVLVHDDMPAKKIFVDIIDTGIGMSKGTIDVLFQKFERGSNANTTNVHGTGLGLYTAFKLAEAMGGTITAYSEGEGKGSKFTVTFPLVH